MSIKKTTEQFSKEVKELTNGEYKVLGEYVTNKVKIKIKHITCGNIYEVRPNDFLNGKRCPKCSNINRNNIRKKTTEQFSKEVKELTNGEYKVLGEYKNNKVKIKIKHITCGNIYEVRPNDFQQGYRCPKCSNEYNNGKKYDLVKSILNNLDIKYKLEAKFKKLYKDRRLRFDFFIKELNLIIEVDGGQHFRASTGSFMIYEMENRVENDWIKNIWCIKNKIKIIRIPYSLCENKIKESLISYFKDGNYNYLIENNIYYFDGKFTFNKISYYSKRNFMYFSRYYKFIEKAEMYFIN